MAKYLVSFSLGIPEKLIVDGDSFEEVSCFVEQMLHDNVSPVWSAREITDKSEEIS